MCLQADPTHHIKNINFYMDFKEEEVSETLMSFIIINNPA